MTQRSGTAHNDADQRNLSALKPRKPVPFSYDWEQESHTDIEVLRAILEAEFSWSMGEKMRQRALACLRRIEAAQ